MDADPTTDADPSTMQTPPDHVTCDACWEGNPPPAPLERMTVTCNNITLQQTSFKILLLRNEGNFDIKLIFSFDGFN